MCGDKYVAIKSSFFPTYIGLFVGEGFAVV
jgi:hypothetical protein